MRYTYGAAVGRLAQRQSACFTSKRSQVQVLHRPPIFVTFLVPTKLGEANTVEGSCGKLLPGLQFR